MRDRVGVRVPSEPHPLDDILALGDFEAIAAQTLDPRAYAYFSTGSADEVTLADNIASWGRWRLRPRVLRSKPEQGLKRTLLGSEVALPVGIAPVALQGLAHPDGEIAMARAAAAAGALFVLSTASSRSMEEVAQAIPAGAPGRRWFQLYVEHDMGFARELVERAEAAGYDAIVLTVDLPVVGLRERDRRAGFDVSADVQAHLPPLHSADPGPYGARASIALSWDDVATIGTWTDVPIVLKGILRAEDALLAATTGARGIIVSNHGGRQLDHSVTAAEVLAEVVEAVGDSLEVYADGGVRRGTDVAVALALGARAVFVGRPMLYALAAAGELGVRHALDIVADELHRTLAILGVESVSEISRDCLRPAT